MQFHLRLKSNYVKIITVAIIFILLATPTFSLAKQDTLENNQKQEIFEIQTKKISSLQINKYPNIETNKISSKIASTMSNDKSILPKNEFLIQKHPQIATNNQQILILAETKQNSTMPTQLTATYSTNQGKTWPERMTISHNVTSFTLPALDYTGDPEMQAYGSNMIDPNTGIQMIYGFPNLTNPDTDYKGSAPDFDMYGWFNGRILAWDPSYWTYLGDTATAGYKHGTDVGPYKNFHGLTIWAGHDGTGWSYYFYCETDETLEEPYKLLWKNYLNGTVLNVDIDIDLATGWEYDLCEILNETTQKPEIQMDMLFLEPGNPEWFNNEQNYGPSWTFKNYTNPAIKASNGYVYLVCEKNGDVYMHHSDDKGFSYSTTQITNSDEIETQPSVTACGKIVTITFVKQNNLYVTTSENGGKEWSEPIPINDQENTVSMEKNNAVIDEKYMVWTNNEQAPTLFFDTKNISLPIIQITNITGGTRINADIQNIGTADANNLTYQILINDCFLLTNREIMGTINLSTGETKKISTNGLILGFGKPTIRIQAGTSTKTIKATLLLFYLKI